MRYIIDIEATNLLGPSLDYSVMPYRLVPEFKVHCVVIRNIDSNAVKTLVQSEITKANMQKALKGCTELIGHNIVGYDLPVLMLYGVLDYRIGYPGEPSTLFGSPVEINDTLLWSKLLNADRFGGHSLEAWGKRLGEYKVHFEDWDTYSEDMLDYCITPENKLLGADLRWKPAHSFAVGDTILGFTENGPNRKFESAIIEIINYEDRPVFEVEFASGKVIKTTEEHRWLVANKNHSGSSYKWVETRNLRTGTCASKIPKLFDVWEEDMSKDAGWLAGMCDGEGHLSKSRFAISVAQRPTLILDKLEKLLGEKYGNVSKRDVKANSDCISLRLNGSAAAKLKFLGQIRPERLISQFTFEKLGRLESKNGLDEVIAVREAGVEQIIKIQTSTRTFVCEGYPMHNCIQDTNVNSRIYDYLIEEQGSHNWSRPYSMEIKLADLTLRQELFGFELDRELAERNLVDLAQKMQEIAAKVDPLLPPKKLGKAELAQWTPPQKQLKKDGTLTSYMQKFIERLNLKFTPWLQEIEYKGKLYSLPFNEPLETEKPATVEDIDTVKSYLMSLGWVPTEVKERDLVKNANKSKKTYQDIVDTIERYVEQTRNSLFQELRLEMLGTTMDNLQDFLMSRIDGNKPIYVPTTPRLTIGLEKEICPNLVALGEKAEFVKDVVHYYTYRHRKNSIAGGAEDDEGEPETGFISYVREDGRVPTPADTLGANTGRYRHKIVCNIPRVTSLYGEQMRGMFRAGKGLWQLGFDFASLEARIMGHYVLPYEDGAALAESLVAEKPNDIHSVNARKLGISRGDAKSFSYAAIYGAQPKKLAKMLGVSESEAKRLYNEYWDAVPALKQLKEKVEKAWEAGGKKTIPGLDGRLLNTRSKHSLINVLFQSGGAIAAKWSTVLLAQEAEKRGILGDPFLHTKKDIKMWLLIAYHDECQFAVHPKLLKVKVYSTDEEAEAARTDKAGAIGHGSKGPYVTERTEPVECIAEGIKQSCAKMKLRVDLGFEYIAGLSWKDCH